MLKDGRFDPPPEVASDPELRVAWLVATMHCSMNDGYALQLYKAWLLMLEAIDFTIYQDTERPFSLRADFQPSASAVSTRHWYKTACRLMPPQTARSSDPSQTHATKLPVRLPGQFTTRGDWFLGVARGSRSSRLADQALDMLTSRRANRTRLHLGMGLPTRDLLDGGSLQHIRTALNIAAQDTHHAVNYGLLVSLGGKYMVEIPPVTDEEQVETPAIGSTKEPVGTKRNRPDQESFFWFYRSGFRDYDRQAIAVQRWLQRLMEWTVRYRHIHRDSWREHTGFTSYDEICAGNLRTVSEYSSFLEVSRALDVFADDLQHCSLAPGHKRDVQAAS